MKVVLLGLAIGSLLSAQAAVTCYPVPDEFRSSLWEMQVDGKVNGVYSARTCDKPFEKYDFGGEYAFSGFEMDAPVTLRIRSLVARDLSQVRIRPASANLAVTKIDDSTLEVKLAKPCQFSLEPNGREHPLLVFANEPETDIPDFSNPKVKAFRGGGVIRAENNGRIELKEGETLYIAAGTVLQGGIFATGANIRICGRGVLDSSPWEWRKGPTGNVLELWKCRDLRVEDITIRGASHWTVVPTNCDGVKIRNIKLCGGRVQNDDGINPCNSRDVAISHCFIRTDDDCIALKGLNTSYGNCENISVKDCILWCDRARVTLLGHESRAPYMRNIRYENIDVVHFQIPVFLLEPGEEMKMENVHADGIRIECDYPERKNPIVVARPTVNMYMRTKVPGHVSDCSFENFTIIGKPASCFFRVEGKDENHLAQRVRFRNVRIFDKPLTPENGLQIGNFTKDVTNE
ncbi:MAG: hypothetical protein IKR48_07860 [Kiritimatiellae bacterium]|nr:hypothetical protein [Kiritimatiellia bacterium]